MMGMTIAINERGEAALSPRGVGRDWQVNCSEAMMRRISRLAADPVMPPLLDALNQIQGILPPKSFPGKEERGYSSWPPAGDGSWFWASELRDLQSLERNQITVMDLWNAAASMCGTLERLLCLGIWGRAGRGTVLLQSGDGINAEERFCLTNITDYNIYRFAQAFPKVPAADKDPVTAAFRLLLGEVALCLDRQPALLNGREKLYSRLEKQLGTDCAGMLSDFFRTPSQLAPQQFLREARDMLSAAADRLQLAKPQELHLYIVLLGTSCRKAAIPALSGVARTFQYCLECLEKKYCLPDIKTTCLFPWNSVQICDPAPYVLPTVSALTRSEAEEKRVPRSGLLDCLNQEIERNMCRGSAPLVCYIEVPERGSAVVEANGWRLSCMEQYLIEELGQKQSLGVCQSLLCGSDIRQPSRLMDYLDMGPAQVVFGYGELWEKMYSAIESLLGGQRYFCRSLE